MISRTREIDLAHVDRRALLSCMSAILTFAALVPKVEAQDNSSATVLITGSSRGIGHEFARQYAMQGWHVIATARAPEQAENLQALADEYSNVSIEALDVLDHDQIDALAMKYRNTQIDVLLNNAGIMGNEQDQMVGAFNFDGLDAIMATNAVGPLKVATAFLDHVALSDQKKIMTVSSRGGTVAAAKGNGRYFYRASKGAVNVFMANLAKDVADRGIIVGLLSPGTVANDFMRAEMKRLNLNFPTVPVEQSVEGMIEVIDGFTLEESGTFIRYTGEPVPG